jgi:hypothetical protein
MWYIAIFNISAITGFTLPGMMLEPGCTAGKRISSNPEVGPDANKRRSLAIFVSESAIVRKDAEKSAKSAIDCMDSNKLSDGYNSVFRKADNSTAIF